MKKTMIAVFVLSSAAFVAGCAVDNSGYADPGYTSYTAGNGFGSTSNGYGPAFQDPAYYNYTGYNRGYYGQEFYRGYPVSAGPVVYR